MHSKMDFCKTIYPRLMYFILTLLGFSFMRNCLTNVPGSRLTMYVFAFSGFEEILHPFKRKIPENVYPFKDKSLANTFLYHANRGSQNSWTDKANHVRDFPIQASLALLQHQLPRGKARAQLQVGSLVSQSGENSDTTKNTKRELLSK